MEWLVPPLIKIGARAVEAEQVDRRW